LWTLKCDVMERSIEEKNELLDAQSNNMSL